jgi:hypothetical protein
MKTWSKEQIEATRQGLEDIVTYSAPNGKIHWIIGEMDVETGARFKNIDGERSGIMTVEDAHNDRYIIKLKNSNTEEKFTTVSELIDAGWVLDIPT